jgi:Carbohydrate binding domain.
MLFHRYRHIFAPVFALLIFVFSHVSHAYVCVGVPVFSYGNASVGNIYQNNGSAYKCIQSWCGWATPGQDSWASDSWEALGECTPENFNRPPTVTIDSPVNDIEPNTEVTFTASAADEDGNLASYSLTIYQVTMDGFQVPMVLDSGESDGAFSAAMQGYWSTDLSTGYAVVARATDSAGQWTEVSETFKVRVNEPEITTLTVTHPDEVVVNQQFAITLVTQSGQGTWPTVTVTAPSGANLTSASGSSTSSSSSTSTSTSSGSGSGPTATRISFYSASELGQHRVDVNWDYAPELNQTSFFEAVAASGPGSEVSVTIEGAPFYQYENTSVAISASHSDTGEKPTFTLQHNDSGAIVFDFNPNNTFSPFAAGNTSASSSGSPTTGYNHRYMTDRYSFSRIGEYTLSVSYPAPYSDTAQTTFEVLASNDDSDSCTAAGVDISTVYAYPNFPNLDWKGDPFNANTGDLMSDNGSVYRANWWTQTVPGSDGSWTYMCDL